MYIALEQTIQCSPAVSRRVLIAIPSLNIKVQNADVQLLVVADGPLETGANRYTVSDRASRNSACQSHPFYQNSVEAGASAGEALDCFVCCTEAGTTRHGFPVVAASLVECPTLRE